MNCKNCGNPIDEVTGICSVCGFYEKTQPQNEQQDTVTVESENKIVENDFVKPSFETIKKPKKFKKLIIAGVAVVLAAAIALAAVLNFEFLKGFAIKSFASNEEYYSFVEKKALNNTKELLVNVYDEGKTNLISKDKATTSTLSFTVGDDVKELISSDSANEIIKLINSTSINIDANVKEQLSQVKLAVNISGSPIFDFDAISDIKGEKIYVSVPSLMDKYLVGEVSFDEEAMILADEKLWEILPTKQIMNTLVDKYLDIALAGIEDVKLTKGTIEVDGISQKCTILEYDFSEKVALKIAQAVFKAMKEDPEIEKIIKEFNKYAVDNDLLDSDENLYDEFIDSINEAISDIKSDIKDASDDPITIVTYVNSKHEVIGRVVSEDSYEYVNYKTAQKGKDFATQIVIDEEVEIIGKGQEKGDVITGEYEIFYDDVNFCTVKLEEFDVSNVKEGIVNGTAKIEPQKVFWEEIGADEMASSLIKLYDPSIEIKVNTSKNSADINVNILGKDEVVLGISCTTQMVDNKEIDTPSNTVDISDEEALNEWLSSLDINKIKNKLKTNLENAGVSSEIIGAIEGFIESVTD